MSETLSFDVCGFTNRTPIKLEEPPRVVDSEPEEIIEYKGFKYSRIVPHDGPANPEKVSPFSRLSSFKDWPQCSPVKVENLVEAGFYYLGTKDCVKCYYCNGGLQEWEKDDDPWVEHARHFSDCLFVLLNKGPAFLEKVKAKPKNVTKPPEVENETDKTKAIKGQEKLEENESKKPDNEVIEKQEEILAQKEVEKSTEKATTEITEKQPEKQTEKQTEQETESQIEPETEKKEINLEEKSTKDVEKREEKECVQKVIVEKERDREKENVCLICLDGKISVSFRPCEHTATCPQCATGVTHCIICRKKIIWMCSVKLVN